MCELNDTDNESQNYSLANEDAIHQIARSVFKISLYQ